MNTFTISRKELEILENLVNTYGEDAVLNEINLSKKNLIGGIASVALGAAMGLHDGKARQEANTTYEKPDNTEQVATANKLNNPYGMTKADYDLFLKKVQALKDEIARVFAKRNIPLSRLNFSPEKMVYLSYLYDFDLPLMISQSRLETGFGTEGVGAKCNSLFSIGAFDKDPTRVKYTSLDDSIEPYIKTVKNNYLLGGKKSVDDLLKDNGYVNGVGNRYASNKEYEKSLRQIRNGIIKNYPIMAVGFTRN